TESRNRFQRRGYGSRYESVSLPRREVSHKGGVARVPRCSSRSLSKWSTRRPTEECLSGTLRATGNKDVGRLSRAVRTAQESRPTSLLPNTLMYSHGRML